jgi:cytochrome oxidase Cu insertion factor (SCO1/SenC/PrrC family)
MNQNTVTSSEFRNKPNRRPFYFVLALFFAPLVLAFAVYYGSGWRPSGMTNKGDLIAPAVPLPQVALITAQGTPTTAGFLRDDWTLVYLGMGDCTAVCRRALSDMQQARLLLGKDLARVKRVFLYSGTCCDAEFFTAQQDLISASLDSEAGLSMLAKFPNSSGAALVAGKIYIVDPLGNLMMSYAPGSDLRNLYQDLKKLLKLSHIG